MKIGFLFLCHDNPGQTADIVKRLLKGTDNEAVIHVDLKADINEFKVLLNDCERAHFIEDRVRAYWAGFNATVAIIKMLEKALELKCDRLVIIQAMSAPLASNEEIRDFFLRYPETEFIRAINVTKASQKVHYMKCHGYHLANVDVKAWDNPKSILHHMISVINKTGIKYRKGYYYDPEKKRRYDVYWGWIHIAITQPCAEHIISVYKNYPGFNRYFMHVFPSDETYIASVIFNSEFASHTVMGGDEPENTDIRIMNYFEYLKGRVRVFENTSELPDLDRERYLFARKVRN